MKQYILRSSTWPLLEKKGNTICVTCGKSLKIGDEITTSRAKDKLKVRCIKCAKRIHQV